MSMRHLMQYLNGAALASIWVFFEHIDKLNYINLQTFNKEIQMVQQQFIIAELSQDSSAITAHITVGNHSHSQAQRSIEQRFNPQRAALNLDDNPEPRQHDIRIEDNFHQENLDQEEASDDEEILPPPKNRELERHDIDDQLFNEENERPLASESNENLFDSQNLDAFRGKINKELLKNILNDDKEEKKKMHEEINLEDEMKHEDEKHHKKRHRHDDESSNMKLEDKTASNDTTQDEASKMNKISFGVFASISHEFILKHTHKADEISLSLQSAFRVISLTRPEYKIILKTLLKCEGIKNYDELGDGILSFVNQIRQSAPPGATDLHFSFTYYDLQAIVTSISHLVSKSLPSIIQKYQNVRKEALTPFDSPTLDFNEKPRFDEKKARLELKIDAQEKSEISSLEYTSTFKTLELYAIQR